MEQTTINYLREQRQRHLDAINAIQHKAEVFAQQYQKAIDVEIQGVEYIENTLTQAGVPIEEEVEELVDEQPNEDFGANDETTEADE